MILSAVRRCALPNSLGPLVCSTICRCARPCHCCRSVTIRFVSGDRDPNGKLTPDDDEGAATTTTTTTKASSSAVPSKTGSEAEESGNRNRKYIEINLFGPKDARAPFPGNIGISPIKYDRQRPRLAPTIEQFRLIQQHNQEQSKRLTTTIERQLFDYETIADRQNRVIEAVAFSRTMESELNLLYEPIRAHLDLRVFECPQLIAGDLKQIFQAKGLDQLSLLMITVNQLECEAPAPLNLQSKAREFIDRMCEMLNNSGFWCDYITPNESGSVF